MAIWIKRVADAGKVFVLVTVVAGLYPLGVCAVELLAELLPKPVALNTLFVQEHIVGDNNDFFYNPIVVNACKVSH